MLTQSVWETWRWIFMSFWSLLDIFFSAITKGFTMIFDAIPVTAIPFLIGLFCYALIDFLTFIANHQDEGVKNVIMKTVVSITSIIVILFAVWRIGIVDTLDSALLSISTISEIVISIVYILFGVAMVYTFLSENGEKVRNWLQAILWFLLLIITFITAPIFEGFEYSFDTLTQILETAIIFGLPKVMLAYNDEKTRGVEYESSKKT